MRTRTLLPTLAVAGLTIGALAAAPLSENPAVTVDGQSVTVTGTLAEPLGRTVIGTDAPDDSTFSGLGADYSEMSVAFPEPGIVAYRTTIGDPNPATGYMPHGARFEVTGVAIGDDTLNLVASANADTGLTVGAQSCAPDPDTGVNTCTTTPVEGGYEDGDIIWLLPTAAAPGDGVTGATATVKPQGSTGTTGGFFLNVTMDEMSLSALAQMPTAELLVDGEVAGTNGLSDTGYEVTASQLAAGDHVLALRLCGGAMSFDRTPTECTTLDLGTVTIDTPTA